MIKINKNDSIIDIIIKINNCKEKEIVLDFPFGHPILHNSTSLKILKNKTGKKELILITNDKTAKNIGKKLGIKYSSLGDTDLLEYNYTFFEYTKYLLKRYLTEIKHIFSNKTPDIISEYQKKYSSANSKVGFFLLGLIISLILLIFVFYFAVNKTYVYITPEITIKNRAENFIFREAKENDIINKDIIKLTKISKVVSLTQNFGTSGINEEKLKVSKGKVRLYNELNEQVDLLKNTRLQSEKGIIYTIDSEVSIPKATISSSGGIIKGAVDINITSKIHDSKGKLTGTRANIGTGVLLNLPGLKTSKDKIYAVTIKEIEGGNDNYEKKLTKEDIENAKKLLETKLKQQALNELKKQIQEDNINNNITYDILGIDDILNYSDLKIIGEDKLKIGESIEKFELSGTIKITSYIYNTEKVLNQLSDTIKERILKDSEKLLFINNKSLTIVDVLSKTSSPLEFKATSQVEAFFSHNFSNDKSNYIEKLKSNILGVNKEDAIKILLNNPQISDVKIEIRPFFINRVSNIMNNIVIKVVEKK